MELSQVSWKRLLRAVFHNRCPYKLAARVMKFLQHAEACQLASRFRNCGRKVDLYSPLYISSPETLEVGDSVSIAPFLHIWAEGGVCIGNRVMIGSHTAITSLTHDYTVPDMQSMLVKRSIVIEDDVWIGSHAVLMPGVRIGEGAVIGAGSVVTKDILPFSIIVGVPGAVLKMRQVSGRTASEASACPTFVAA